MNEKNKGYTLVEVLVAMTILVIAVMPMFGTYPRLIQSTQRSSETEGSGLLATTVIEYIKSAGYETVAGKIPGYKNFPKEYDKIFDKTYTLTRNADESAYTSAVTSGSAFQTDFGYADTNNENFFYLNPKMGMNMQNVKIRVVLGFADVYIRNSTDSAVYLPGDKIYENFIMGKVLISGTSGEKEIKFVLTPIEDRAVE